MLHSGKCLTYSDDHLLLDECETNDKTQQWFWRPIKPRNAN